MMLPNYEVYALRYATVDRRRRENFITPPDPHDGPMPMDYYVWLLRDGKRHYLVDTGFNEAGARARARRFLRCPIEALSAFGLAPQDISDVIVTHLHYDHAGNIRLLPRARLHLQESEMHYACGCNMRFDTLRHAYAVEDVVDVLRGVYDKRVNFCHGHEEIAPGLQVLHIGGHTQGLQSVRVHTERGWVVLASDASHYYDNMQEGAPFPIVYNVADMLAGYETLAKYAESPQHIIPGHDPAVLARYPRLDGRDIVALHRPPLA
ncbi:N-acyl homoserine lactonase family protein [Bordetella hinzii]|uniref:N-acyl homoserine lactonase family protein n=2 Tax=Bordetella hinzii TaxID=103855 RepID=A0AAN1VF69_9BORD|nr:N-acyl homoserine lactonase family protein [Bordetella hinzii]QDJ31746.1 MBL fold hydrolase [Bordetella hinzii]QDJ36203.1 MBL fold hydrolase [Bordetella hinzii]QDJ40765.1 MBL fold hydrolase [Bordetella hinzii]QDJ45323.1 MBL fold hydrolase [Bordetella hinzii]